MQTSKFALKVSSADEAKPKTNRKTRAFKLDEEGDLIEITPLTNAWRLAIRLYEDIEDADWSDNNHHPEIMFASKAKGNASSKNVLFSYINFYSSIEQQQEAHEYDLHYPIKVFLKPLLDRSNIFISYSIGINHFEYELPVRSEIRGFGISLEAISGPASANISITSTELDSSKVNSIPFRIGNVVFRLGNLEDNEVLLQSQHMILPVSSEGNPTPIITRMSNQFDIPKPKAGSPGTLQTFARERSNQPFYISYALSVFQQYTELQIIEELCLQIAQLMMRSSGIANASLPLLGTGTGMLRPIEVAQLYINIFEPLSQFHLFFVSVRDLEVFKNINVFFASQALPAPFFFTTRKPIIISQLEEKLDIKLNEENYKLDDHDQLISLTLNSINDSILFSLESMPYLERLEINGSQIEDLGFLYRFEKLTALRISNSNVTDFSPIFNCQRLEFLDLSATNCVDTENFRRLPRLKTLILKGNGIYNIDALYFCKELIFLDLSSNEINDAAPLSALKNLHTLYLSKNFVSDLSFIRRLTKLKTLDVSYNRIKDAKSILRTPRLRQLFISNNPIEHEYDIKISDYENHVVTLRNYLLRQEEKRKIEIEFPVKVLLLGNHASGKSTLLNYFQTKGLKSDIGSTHIIKIEPYPKSYQRFPSAIFFDFGGQDYYHGIYRAFLSGGAIYLLLWQTSMNDNVQAIDSRGIMSQNFKLDYWLHQKRYLEQERFNSSDPILLVQTHAEKDPKMLPDCLTDLPEMRGDFHISLKAGFSRDKSYNKTSAKNYHALEYLQETLHELIEERKAVRKEPQWYINFVNIILQKAKTANHIPIYIKELIPFYQRDEEDVIQYLLDDLEQLHRQGLILYYQENMPEKAWLNPVALVEYIHNEVLNTVLLDKSVNGEIEFERLQGIDSDVVQLLVHQKVLFLHQWNNRYIIPNYLPLANDTDTGFDLMTFGLGSPLFVLKFKHFIPFGLINQIICSFGELPDKKRFWRDQLLFTLENKVKVLIKIDFSLLEIRVYSHFFGNFENINQDECIKYLFYGLLANYWDMEILTLSEFRQFHDKTLKVEDYDISHPMFIKISQATNVYDNHACQPIDLYISVDDQHYVSYQKICSLGNEVQLPCLLINPDRTLSKEIVSRPVFPFQPFTLKELRRPKKAVISYSKKDIAMVDKFRQYLVPLADDGLIENPWYCTELIAGTMWDETIQQKFNEADIIFFMVSENLLATSYVKEYEIKKAIDRWNYDRSIRIVPIILVPYHWARSGAYNLADFTALPYTAYPISSFPDTLMAWNYVSEAIRIMLENDLYPGSDKFAISNDMEQFFQRVMDYRLGKAL